MTTLDGLSKHERAYALIRRRILDGTYQPDQRLVIDALAGELGVSAVPVREAIRRLEAEGRVVYRRNAGSRVAPVDGRRHLRIGIDIGRAGTNAVLMDGHAVVTSTTAPSTADIAGNTAGALETLMRDARVGPAAIAAVTIGTDHFTDAFVERRVAPVACVRLGLPATTAIPPMADWPDDARAALGRHSYLAHGGHEVDGRPLSPVDAAELRAIAADIGGRGVAAVALSAVFSPLTAAAEERAAAVLRAALPGVDITLSHKVGRLGLLERENAAIINACLRDGARATIADLREALQRLGIVAALYLTRNDGTLLAAATAERYPVLTFASGTANSMRGAAALGGLGDGVVIDAGEATTDIGVLARGFPREREAPVLIGGVRTNLRMPDVRPIASGPTIDRIAEAVGRAVDRARGGEMAAPIVMVGGGAPALRALLPGHEIIVPEHHAVANAVGAATALVSGTIDRVVPLEGVSRQEAVAGAVSDAVAQAIMAGADAHSVRIIAADDAPLPYLPGNLIRVSVKAVGELATRASYG